MTTALQLTAAEQALGVALPHRRMEDWRWTDLRARIAKPYASQKVEAAAKDVERLLASSPFTAQAKARVVFVNGVLDKTNSVIPAQAGIQLSNNADDAKRHSRLRGNDEKVVGPLVAMNNSLKPAGVTLEFTGNVVTPVEIIHISTNAAPRAIGLHNRIHVAAQAAAAIIETFVGEGDYVLNSLTEITLGEGAHLERLKLQAEAAAATHLSHTIFDLGTQARLNDVSVQIGAQLTRQNGTVNFTGENAEAKLNGAYLLREKQHCDTALVINHAVPHCVSRELFKCVMDDDARGIFQGKVVVARDAQKTDGKQSSHALLLSERAEFDAKPELEIFADDVVCGHGATAGDLNADHLFYLESRGIPKKEARALLISAFVAEAFDGVADDGLRNALANLAEHWVVGK